MDFELETEGLVDCGSLRHVSWFDDGTGWRSGDVCCGVDVVDAFARG